MFFVISEMSSKTFVMVLIKNFLITLTWPAGLGGPSSLMARLVQLLREKAGNSTGVIHKHADRIPQSTVAASQEKEEDGSRSRGLKKFRGLFKELQDVKEKRCIFVSSK